MKQGLIKVTRVIAWILLVFGGLVSFNLLSNLIYDLAAGNGWLPTAGIFSVLILLPVLVLIFLKPQSVVNTNDVIPLKKTRTFGNVGVTLFAAAFFGFAIIVIAFMFGG